MCACKLVLRSGVSWFSVRQNQIKRFELELWAPRRWKVCGEINKRREIIISASCQGRLKGWTNERSRIKKIDRIDGYKLKRKGREKLMIARKKSQFNFLFPSSFFLVLIPYLFRLLSVHKEIWETSRSRQVRRRNIEHCKKEKQMKNRFREIFPFTNVRDTYNIDDLHERQSKA